MYIDFPQVDGRLNIVKMLAYPQLWFYRFYVTPVKIPTCYSMDINRLILKFIYAKDQEQLAHYWRRKLKIGEQTYSLTRLTINPSNQDSEIWLTWSPYINGTEYRAQK